MYGLAFIAHGKNRQAEKEEAAAEKEDGKKKKGGVQVPAEWPWEEAKKVFEQPDVTPSDQIEVGGSFAFTFLQAWLITRFPAAGMGDTGRRRSR